VWSYVLEVNGRVSVLEPCLEGADEGVNALIPSEAAALCGQGRVDQPRIRVIRNDRNAFQQVRRVSFCLSAARPYQAPNSPLYQMSRGSAHRSSAWASTTLIGVIRIRAG
jgi:hypothetical protein